MKQEVGKAGNKRNFHWGIAVLCLIYGGISLFIFIHQSYSIYLREQMPASAMPASANLDKNASLEISHARERFRSMAAIPLATTFLGSVISILGGVSLLNLLRKRESKELKKDILESVILPDEKLVIQELEKNNGELTQSEMVRNTKLSKVRVHRIIKRLESMGVITKHPYGLTNKIKLEKLFHSSE